MGNFASQLFKLNFVVAWGKLLEIDPCSHDDWVEVVDVVEGFGFAFSHFGQLVFWDCGKFVNVNPVSLVLDQSLFEYQAVVPFKDCIRCALFKFEERGSIDILGGVIELFLFWEFGKELLALSLSFLFGFSDFFLLFVGLRVFGVLFASFFVFLLLFAFFFIGEFAGTDFAFEKLEFGHSDSVSEEARVGLIGGFPLIGDGVDAVDFELGLDSVDGEGDFVEFDGCHVCL